MNNNSDYFKDFKGDYWRTGIDVRDFIQHNYTPYTGDDGFLQPPTKRTLAVWDTLKEMFKEETKKGVYDAEVKIPQGIDAYGPGYISKENEVIVGLQTDAPLKRGIYPKGGWRMVEKSLEAYGFTPDPVTKEIFTKYRKTHNDGVFSAYTEDMRARPHYR